MPEVSWVGDSDLVGGLEYDFFPYIGNNTPNWLIYFQRGWNHQLVQVGL